MSGFVIGFVLAGAVFVLGGVLVLAVYLAGSRCKLGDDSSGSATGCSVRFFFEKCFLELVSLALTVLAIIDLESTTLGCWDAAAQPLRIAYYVVVVALKNALVFGIVLMEWRGGAQLRSTVADRFRLPPNWPERAYSFVFVAVALIDGLWLNVFAALGASSLFPHDGVVFLMVDVALYTKLMASFAFSAHTRLKKGKVDVTGFAYSMLGSMLPLFAALTAVARHRVAQLTGGGGGGGGGCSLQSVVDLGGVALLLLAFAHPVTAPLTASLRRSSVASDRALKGAGRNRVRLLQFTLWTLQHRPLALLLSMGLLFGQGLAYFAALGITFTSLTSLAAVAGAPPELVALLVCIMAVLAGLVAFFSLQLCLVLIRRMWAWLTSFNACKCCKRVPAPLTSASTASSLNGILFSGKTVSTFKINDRLQINSIAGVKKIVAIRK